MSTAYATLADAATGQSSPLGMIVRAPAVLSAAFAFGAIETSAMGLLPVHAVRNGFSAETGALFVTALALGNLLARDGRAATLAAASSDPLAAKKPPLPAKAKNVIFMFMEGGPSQLDLFDPKPELAKWDGKPLPESLTKNLQLAFIKPTAAVLASRREFRKYGQSGIEISDYMPHLGSVADDICLVRSMHTDAFNHHPGQLLLFSGTTQVGRPSFGSWVVYGLG